MVYDLSLQILRAVSHLINFSASNFVQLTSGCHNKNHSLTIISALVSPDLHLISCFTAASTHYLSVTRHHPPNACSRLVRLTGLDARYSAEQLLEILTQHCKQQQQPDLRGCYTSTPVVCCRVKPRPEWVATSGDQDAGRDQGRLAANRGTPGRSTAPSQGAHHGQAGFTGRGRGRGSTLQGNSGIATSSGVPAEAHVLFDCAQRVLDLVCGLPSALPTERTPQGVFIACLLGMDGFGVR